MVDETRDDPNSRGMENPARRALLAVADKWLVVVVYALHSGVTRPSELRRFVGGVSQPILTKTLRRMEASGLVTRTAYPEVPPRVEYALTERGESLATAVAGFAAWAEANADAFPAEPEPPPDEDDDFF